MGGKLSKYDLSITREFASGPYSYQAFFLDISKKTQAQKKLKTQGKSWKNSSKTPKKLKNRQLQLSWVVAKLNENSIFSEKA